MITFYIYNLPKKNLLNNDIQLLILTSFLELKLCFDRLALHIDSGHTFVPEAKLLNKMSTKNLKIKCPNEFALMNTIE